MASESHIRWRGEALKQKQTASALLLGLSGGALAFSVAQLHTADMYIGFWQSFWFHLHAIAQFISMTCGVAFCLNRLRDFELTAKIAKTREDKSTAKHLGEMRAKVRRLGRFTNWFFLIQIIAFFVAIIAFVAFVLILYRHPLYAIFLR